MDLFEAIGVSASGMAAQSKRMKIVSENIANADSIDAGGGKPYRRRLTNFETEVDHATGLHFVSPGEVTEDKTPFRTTYNPGHELADENGFVSYPNVNTILEMIDLREASRAYEANMSSIEAAKEMMVRSLDLLR